jgi:hypothetical protein
MIGARMSAAEAWALIKPASMAVARVILIFMGLPLLTLKESSNRESSTI